MRSSIGFIDKWRQEFEQDSSLRYVFDRVTKGTGAKGEIERVMDKAIALSESENKRTGVQTLVGYSFESKKLILPLQASDILAWTVFQQMLAKGEIRELNWAARSVSDYLGAKIEAGYFDRARLEQWVAMERAELRKRGM
jgi:hypothetical protein